MGYSGLDHDVLADKRYIYWLIRPVNLTFNFNLKQQPQRPYSTAIMNPNKSVIQREDSSPAPHRIFSMNTLLILLLTSLRFKYISHQASDQWLRLQISRDKLGCVPAPLVELEWLFAVLAQLCFGPRVFSRGSSSFSDSYLPFRWPAHAVGIEGQRNVLLDLNLKIRHIVTVLRILISSLVKVD